MSAGGKPGVGSSNCRRQPDGPHTYHGPGADLGVVAAVASSVRNRGLVDATATFGEVGLSGEVRGTPQAPLRLLRTYEFAYSAQGDDRQYGQLALLGTQLLWTREPG